MIYVGSQARVSTQGGSGMKRLAWIIGASFALCVAPTAVFAQGNGLDLSVSGHSVRAAFDSEITLSGLDLSFEGMHNNDNGDVARSEERRVGKEGRWRVGQRRRRE